MDTLETRAEERERETTKDSNIAGVTSFVIMCVLFVVGFGLMSVGYSEESALLFFAGIVACSLSFFIPMTRRD